jgi:hypothetical protein
LSYLAHNKVIKFLDQSVREWDDVIKVDKIIQKIKKCREGLKAGYHIAEMIGDESAQATFSTIFEEEYDIGFEFVVKHILTGYEVQSQTIHKNIDDQRKLVYLYRKISKWKNFDIALTFLYKVNDEIDFKIINPHDSNDWKELGSIRGGSIVNIYVKPKSSKDYQDLDKVFEKLNLNLKLFKT